MARFISARLNLGALRFNSGGPDMDRTCDLLLAKQLLYQLRYEPENLKEQKWYLERDLNTHKLLRRRLSYPLNDRGIKWSGRQGSNLRHQVWKTRSLPTEILPHYLIYNFFKIKPPGALLRRTPGHVVFIVVIR